MCQFTDKMQIFWFTDNPKNYKLIVIVLVPKIDILIINSCVYFA